MRFFLQTLQTNDCEEKYKLQCGPGNVPQGQSVPVHTPVSRTAGSNPPVQQQTDSEGQPCPSGDTNLPPDSPLDPGNHHFPASGSGRGRRLCLCYDSHSQVFIRSEAEYQESTSSQSELKMFFNNICIVSTNSVSTQYQLSINTGCVLI